MIPTIDERLLRFWIHRHGGTWRQGWRLLSRTNDEATARWLYRNALDARQPGGVRLIDVETNTVLEHSGAPPAPNRW